MSGNEARRNIAPVIKDRMSRARTPLGSVPISAIYGYEYPWSNGLENGHISSSKHENAHDYIEHSMRTKRAFSEFPIMDSSNYALPSLASLSFRPMALEASRANTPIRSISIHRDSSPYRSLAPLRAEKVPEPPRETPRTTTISYSSTTPWNSTGFYYTPRYPQSYRGTASTYNAYSRRYPARRFIPSYVPFKYTRRY